ncbi:MAG: AprI/Inh family metalloprotease inhibitor [Pseudolabrys sp.]
MKSAGRMIYRLATAAAVTLVLGGCAAGLPGSADTGAPSATMTGRWMLAAPNAPMCGLMLRETVNAQGGSVAPDGGCPANMYLGSQWVLEQGVLIIKSHDDEPLARLNAVGDSFQGQSASGTPVTLTRYSVPAAQ